MILFTNIKEIWTSADRHPFGRIDVMNNAAVLVDEGNIIDMGESRKLERDHPRISRINCDGLTMLPGFVDPHTHPVFYKTREEEFIMRGQGMSYEEIAAAGGGIRNSVRAFRQASLDEIFELSVPRVKRFLEFGTTTIEAKSGYGLSLEDEIKSLQIIKNLDESLPLTLVPTFLGAHEVPDEYRNQKEKYIDIVCNEMIPRVAQDKLAVFCDVFCEKNVFEIEESRRILLAAKKHGLIPKLHADELNPMGGAELSAEVGAVSADHLLKVSEQGINAMKEAGVIPVILPGTAFFLGKRDYAPARKMIDARLAIALATDYNPGSSHTQNMQMMMTLAAIYLHMKPEEYLDAVTRISARAIKIDKYAGTLEKGKWADFILTAAPNMSVLAYHYGVNHVVKVYKKGKLVFQNLNR